MRKLKPKPKRGGRTKAPTTRLRPRGRPTSLTNETITLVCKYVRQGVSYTDAARGAGIDKSTFIRWRERGRADRAAHKETEFSNFYDRVELADFQLKAALVNSVITGATLDARIALKVLERRYPDEWGLTIKIEDVTSTQPESPRERFLKRLAEIEDRHQRAEATVRHVLHAGASDIADGARGGPVLPTPGDDGVQ